MIRGLIVDDERLARRGLALRLGRRDDIEIVAQCADAESALAAVEKQHPDVVFLDISMPGMTGLELVEQLPQRAPPLVVFVTAFNEFAVAAFEQAAVDYLLKPVTDDQLERALSRVASRLSGASAVSDRRDLLEVVRRLTGRSDLSVEQAVAQLENADTLVIRDAGDIRRLPVGDIEYVSAAGDYMCVTAAGETHVIRETMDELTAQLAGQGFIRIHRSTLVNARRVRAFTPNAHGDGHVEMHDGTEFRCSRTYRSRLVDALERLP